MKPLTKKMPDHSPHTPPHKQRGFTLLLATTVALGISASVAIGLLVLQQRTSNENTLSAQQTLQWADEALAGFAALHGRLPCPADTPNGSESCDQGAKGWLPTATLGASHSRIDEKALPRLRYIVYRKQDHDPQYQGRDTRDIDLAQTHLPLPPPTAVVEEPDFNWCWDRNGMITSEAGTRYLGGKPPPPEAMYRSGPLSKHYLCGGKALQQMKTGIGTNVLIVRFGYASPPTHVTVIYDKYVYDKPTRVEHDRLFAAVLDELRGNLPIQFPDPSTEAIDAAPLDKFMPRKPSFNPFDPRKADVYDIERTDALDLCDKLQRASPAQTPGRHADVWRLAPRHERSSLDYAYIETQGKADPENVAYAVALASPLGESALNADNTRPAFEIPAQTLNARHTDAVRATTFHQLSQKLGCPQLLSSLDVLATFVESTTGVEAAKEAMKGAWAKYHVMYKMMLANRAYRTLTATVNLAITVKATVRTLPKMFGAIADCAMTVGISCPRMAAYIASLAAYATTTKVQVASLAGQIAHLSIYVNVFNTYKNVSYEAGVPGAESSGDFELDEGCKLLDSLAANLADATKAHRDLESNVKSASDRHADAAARLRELPFHQGVLDKQILPILEEYVYTSLLYEEQKALADQARENRRNAEKELPPINQKELSDLLNNDFGYAGTDDLLALMDQNQEQIHSDVIREAIYRESAEAAKLREVEAAYTSATQARDQLLYQDVTWRAYCSGCPAFAPTSRAAQLEAALRDWELAKRQEEAARELRDQLTQSHDHLERACQILAETDPAPPGVARLPWSDAIEALHKSLETITHNRLKANP